MRAAALLFLALVWAGRAHGGTITCAFDNGSIVVPAAFGDIAGDFLLDLSAPRSTLHATVAEAAGTIAPAAVAPLRLAGRRIARTRLEVADLDGDTAGFPTGISGVLGADVIAPYGLSVAAEPCRLSLDGGPLRPRPQALRLPLRIIAGVPAVRAGVSDGATSRYGWFAIDTAGFPVRLAQATLSRSPPAGETADSRRAPPARLAALSLGGRLFQRLPAALMSDPPAGLAGAIGEAVWSRFSLRLDMRRGWLELTPAPTAGVPP